MSLRIKKTIEVGSLIGYLLKRDLELRNEYDTLWTEDEKRECWGRVRENSVMLKKLGWNDICDKINNQNYNKELAIQL